jgi:hypothetical protein
MTFPEGEGSCQRTPLVLNYSIHFGTTRHYNCGEKNGPEEGCETKGQENITFNEAHDHHGEP